MNNETKKNTSGKYDYNPLYDEHLVGLHGWLMLLGIGILYSFLSNLYYILTNVINNGGWSVLMQSFQELKNQTVDWIAVVEVLLYFLTTVLLIHLLILFFFKKKGFPKWYIGLKLLTVIVVFLELYLVYFELPYSKELRERVIYDSVTYFVGACIWIPYLLVSRRVRFTFIN